MTRTLASAWDTRLKLLAEGNKLLVEGDKLRAEGDKLWAAAILETRGNVALEWVWRADKQDYACILETGEVFEPTEKIAEPVFWRLAKYLNQPK